jgi:RES domain-containing protein
VIVWRLCRAKYADLSGVGGLRAQGRWNNLGHPVIYASATLSLSVLERRVHTRLRPRDEVAMQIELPDDTIEHLAQQSTEWQTQIEYTRFLGTEWLVSSRSVCLAVPSVLVSGIQLLDEPETLGYGARPDCFRRTVRIRRTPLSLASR